MLLKLALLRPHFPTFAQVKKIQKKNPQHATYTNVGNLERNINLIGFFALFQCDSFACFISWESNTDPIRSDSALQNKIVKFIEPHKIRLYSSLLLKTRGGHHESIHCWAKKLALGCVNSTPVARGSQEAGFTQPRAHFFPHPCS